MSDVCLLVCQYMSHIFTFSTSSEPLHAQTPNNCSSMNPEEVLHLFEAITNPRWLSWPLIGRNTFDFLSRTAACEVMFL